MKKTNINDIQYNYAELDLALICEDRYKELKPIDILTFTLLKNQESLSLESVKRGNKSFVDEEGNVFVVISQKKLSKITRVSERTLRDILKRLENCNLIFIEQVGQNKCNKMYIGEPIRTTTLGEYIEKIGLEVLDDAKEKDNLIKLDRLDKIGNKKVASTAHTNNFDESLSNNNSKHSINTNIVPQDTENIQEKNINVNVQLLKNSNIKYINYKKNNDKIIAMDTKKLEKAIALTIEKADKPNWNYLITTYDSISESNSIKPNNIKNTKTKFHNFESNLDNITEEEFNKKYDEALKIKNGEVKKVKNEFTEDTDPAKRLYLEAVNNNWDNIGAGTYNIAKQYAIKYNKSYK